MRHLAPVRIGSTTSKLTNGLFYADCTLTDLRRQILYNILRELYNFQEQLPIHVHYYVYVRKVVYNSWKSVKSVPQSGADVFSTRRCKLRHNLTRRTFPPLLLPSSFRYYPLCKGVPFQSRRLLEFKVLGTPRASKRVPFFLLKRILGSKILTRIIIPVSSSISLIIFLTRMF